MRIHKESVRFRCFHLILRGPRLTFVLQIYARKTHAENVSVHKTMLEVQMILF